MNKNLKLLEHNNLSLLIGENGSGKSRKLSEIAELAISRNKSVIAVANCLYDKFRDHGKKYFFIGARYGNEFTYKALEKVIKKTIERPIQSLSSKGYLITAVMSQ